MDTSTLARAMGCSTSKARQYVADFNKALVQAGCTTTNRAAMFCAQVGHESVGLVYMEEIASGAAYEGRRDLGNTQPGDGRRFKGRGPIQLTGRHNYGLFGTWAKSKGLVNDAAYFQKNPTKVATSQWGFLAAAWYWTVARPYINSLCDKADIVGVTKAINGGTNGLQDRVRRWNTCRGLGNAVLPSNTGSSSLVGKVKAAAQKKPQEVEMPVIIKELEPGKNKRAYIPLAGLPPYVYFFCSEGEECDLHAVDFVKATPKKAGAAWVGGGNIKNWKVKPNRPGPFNAKHVKKMQKAGAIGMRLFYSADHPVTVEVG